jgi:hypothetical protein
MLRGSATAVMIAVCALAYSSAPAMAEECPAGDAYAQCRPGWEVSARNYPTNLAPGHRGAIRIEVFNVGAGSSVGTVTVTDTLPHGVTATDAGELVVSLYQSPEDITIAHVTWDCTGNGPGEAPRIAGATVVTCTNDPIGMPSLLGGAGNTSVHNDGNAQIAIAVQVAEGATEDLERPEASRVTVAGGGALDTASTTDPITISSKPSAFRFSDVDAWFSNADGTLDMQAGSHPYAATVSFGISTVIGDHGELTSNGNEPRNIAVELPPGFVGDTTAVPQCSRPDLIVGRCPQASEVGNAVVDTFFGALVKLPIFNMVPPPGSPAQLGFNYGPQIVFLDTGVRSGGDYGITARVNNVPQEAISHVVTTLWGIPGDPSHDRWRGRGLEACSQGEIEKAGNACSAVDHPSLRPFLTLPTSCAAPPKFTVSTNTWEHPQEAPIEDGFEWHDSNGDPTALSGCEHLGFAPTIATSPDTARADTPAGFAFELTSPLGGLEAPEGLGTSDIQGTTVTLPEGLVVNPGQAAGLQVCQESESGLGTEEAPRCPSASKVGTVTASTPLLEGSAEKELQGNVYVMQSNPPNLKLLVAPSADGVNIKQVLNVSLNEATGQITTTTANFPQAPVSDVKLSFSGGPQAALLTPRACGVFTTTSDFAPWSSPFVADAFPTASFALSEGPGGGSCPPNQLPFGPSMTAGTLNNQAGGFSPLSVTFSRQDQEQDASGMSVTTPPGLLAILKGVERCPEPQAGQGTCGPNSLIGHTTVAVGAGPDPFVVQGGQVFLTGPYKGAPFGLSVVVPAVAGPFNLGNVIVRATIGIDPHTAQPTIVSDPLPRILHGVPLQLKTVNVTIDRPGFMFNPTDCEPLAVTGTITSTQGVTAPVSSRFQAANCANLPFHPVFAVSTQAKTSKKNGASLTVKGAFPAGEANIHSVAVTLPKQLPARLTTIQQACPAAVFAANPASCTAGSNIGVATASTPILANPVSGPAYLVSHGGAAFPDVVVILQGEGVTVDLTGSVDIKHGVTSSTFATVPDAPISSFQLTLPEGPHSGLAAVVPAKAKGNMCAQKLTMPFTITAQNGTVLKQNTKIAVTGCPKPKKAVKKKHTRRAHGRKAKHRR